MADPIGQQTSPFPPPPDPGGGVPRGDLHEIIRRLEAEFKKQGKPVHLPELYEEAYKEIHPNKDLNPEAIKSRYAARQNMVRSGVPEVSTRQDLERAAGVGGSRTKEQQNTNSEETEWPRALDVNGQHTSNESLQKQEQTNDGIPEAGASEKNTNSRAETYPDTAQEKVPTEEITAKPVDGIVPKDEEMPAAAEAVKEDASATPEAEKPAENNAGEHTGGGGSEQEKDAKDKKQAGSDATPEKKGEQGSAAESTTSPEAKPATKHPPTKGSADMLGSEAHVPATGKNSPWVSPEQAKQLKDTFLHQGAKAGAKEAVKLAAQQGADKAFWALLDASPADLGIVTIGLGGTTLLVLGHIFDVQLQSWQKWGIIIYDIVLILLLFFAVIIILFLYCNTPPAMFYPSCFKLNIVNALF